MLPGLAAGFVQTLVGHPFDTLKTRIQNKNLHFRNLYAGCAYPFASSMLSNAVLFRAYGLSREENFNPFLSGAISGACVSPIIFASDCFKVPSQLGMTKGGGRMAFRGFPLTCFRETLAFAIYFDVYERARGSAGPIVSGGLAGMINWLVTYPIDCVRTRQIAHNVSVGAAFYQGGLYKGVGVVLVRAMLVNAAIFQTYEIFC